MTKFSRILLVEDDQFIIDIYTSSLRTAGYTVETASTGPEALEKVKLIRPDLILLDILIPEISGLQVAHTLRTDPEYKAMDTKIIMLTNLGIAQAGARAEEEHVEEYLVKADITPNELVAHIKAIEDRPDES